MGTGKPGSYLEVNPEVGAPRLACWETEKQSETEAEL